MKNQTNDASKTSETEVFIYSVKSSLCPKNGDVLRMNDESVDYWRDPQIL